MSSKRIFVTAAVLLLAGVLLAACAPSAPAVNQVTLIGNDISWNLESIETKVGQTLELTVRNDGVLDHDLVIEEFGIDILLSPGAEEIVTIVPDEAMVIEYICSIPGHEEAGMVGRIIVTE